MRRRTQRIKPYWLILLSSIVRARSCDESTVAILGQWFARLVVCLFLLEFKGCHESSAISVETGVPDTGVPFYTSPRESIDGRVRDNRPNILMILSDDHACQAISAYGSVVNQTPNIVVWRIKGSGLFSDNSHHNPTNASGSVEITEKYILPGR